MKNTIKILLIIASALPVPCSLLPLPCLSATYTLVGERHLRKYTAQAPSQVYNAETDAQQIVNNLCFVDWTRSTDKNATSTSHTESQLDKNVDNREKFDAAIFCAQHTNGTHVAYANAAVYRYRLPDGTLPILTSLSAYVSSDPYNTLGARIVLMTNSTGEIPTDCATCRGDVEGGIKAEGVAPRITRTVSGKNYWYPASSNVVFSSSNGLSTGLQLQKYLFVFVLMENYATSRGNWLEGCSYIDNCIRITTSDAVPGWTDGSTVDLSNFSEDDDEIDVTEAENIPWHGRMAAYERKMTVVRIMDANGNSSYFGAPETAYRLLHRNDTNLTAITHVVFRYGSSWGLGPKTNLTQASFAPSERPVKVRSVYAEKSVTVMHGAVRMERGYEVNPPTRDFTDTDRGLVGSYASAFGLSYGSSESLASSTSIPVGWLLYCGATTYADTDGDGLDIVHEWNNGNSPTDPFNPDTDADTIVDGYALLYHLNGEDRNKDFDGDGLSNYAEYLISNVFAFASTSPDTYATDSSSCDYFKKKGDLYLGEIFTDHDRIDDTWELLYPSACNPYIYDPDRDDDGDGWSNYAEFKAKTDPTRVTKDDGSPEYPVPTVTMRLARKVRIPMNSSVRVFAWNENSDKEMVGAPDATWTATNDDGTVVFTFRESDGISLTCGGHLKEGKTSFVVFEDSDENGLYTPGEPFGVARGVDVGWQGASFTVELDETISITPRFSPWDSEVCDRGTTFDESIRMLLSDRTKRADTNIVNTISNQVQEVNAVNERVHVRFVRFGVNDMFAYLLGVGFGDAGPNPIVSERTYDRNCRDYICEADFLGDGEFDIDWARLRSEVIDYGPVQTILGAEVTNVTYLAVLDGGSGNEYWIRGSEDTTTTIRALSTTIERRFEKLKHAPVAENVNGVCYSARPTFRWSLPNEEVYAKKYGTSYTAFKLQIFLADGLTKIYDSGVQRAPAQDANGVFSWTADVSAGDLTKLGKQFASTGNYMWSVAMYNAKFKPVSNTSDLFSGKARFSVAANAQQEMNDHQYSSIDVAVKYAGPAIVLDSLNATSVNVIDSYMNLTSLVSKVRVQAFATADFAGDPLSETVVTTNVDNLGSAVANVRLVGLPATGTYYVRAYIDSNGNHSRDEWESWGAAKEAVTLTSAQVTAPLVSVWIEDCDVDQDWLPDAWEYVKFGTIAEKSANVKSGSKTIFTTDMASGATTRLASFSTGLEGASLTIFENGAWANQLLGWGVGGGNITFDDIRQAVKTNIVERIGQ